MTLVIYLHANDLQEITAVLDYPAIDLRSMNVVIYLHAIDSQEMTKVICYPANAL